MYIHISSGFSSFAKQESAGAPLKNCSLEFRFEKGDLAPVSPLVSPKVLLIGKVFVFIISYCRGHSLEIALLGRVARARCHGNESWFCRDAWVWLILMIGTYLTYLYYVIVYILMLR